MSVEELKGCGVTATTLVWKHGMPAWKKAIALPELYNLFAEEYNQSFMPHDIEQESFSVPVATETTNASVVYQGSQLPTDLSAEEEGTSAVPSSKKMVMDLLRTDKVMSEFIENHPNGFLLSLVVLASFVIASDGIVMDEELEYLENFLLETFGEEVCREYIPLIPRIMTIMQKDGHNTKVQKLQHICESIKGNIEVSDRELLLDFLEDVAGADGCVSAEEQQLLCQIRKWIQ